MSTPGPRTVVDAAVPSARPVSSFGTGEEAARKVRADQRGCWQRGQRVHVEDYLRWAPDLADDAEVLLDIVYSEFMLREEFGDRPDPEEFVQRFPQFEAPLRRQFQLHAVLDDGTLLEEGSDSSTASSDDPEHTIVALPDDDSSATSIVERIDVLAADRTLLTDVDEDAVTVQAPPPDMGPGVTPEMPVSIPPRAADTAPQPQRRAALTKLKSALLAAPGEGEAEGRGTVRAVVPGYEILGELGRGAVGVVYKARQLGLNRLVALKMILAGSHASRQALARFRAEAAAVARLTHQNIVQIYDIGESEGLPYFSLEFCPGGPLSGYLDGTPLPGDEAARVIETLARAMQYAHEHGIVHRDLKPANVLVTGDCDFRNGAFRQTVPQRTGEWESAADAATVTGLKVADFGLAKRLDESSQTKTGAVLGTPSYMAPEQASGHIHDITPLADVYALGAILYELLTGRPPFRAATAIETVVQVLNDEPVPPRRLQSRVPEDLETIAIKCLEKDKAKRYASAQALADDLARFLRREPILARPVGPLGRAFRWCRRNPVVASLSGLAVALLVGGTTVSILFAREASAQRADAIKSADEAKTESLAARRNLYVAQMNLAQRAWQDVQMARMHDLLDNQRPERTGVDLRGFEWYYWDRKARGPFATCAGHNAAAECVAYAADGRLLATGGKDCTVRVWSAADGTERAVLSGHTGTVVGVVFLPGARLASAAAVLERREGETLNAAELIVWNLETRKVALRIAARIDDVKGLAASPDGTRLATAANDGVRVWDAVTGKELHRPDGPGERAMGVAFAADGRLAAAFDDGSVCVWGPAGDSLFEAPKHGWIAQSVCFSPDGRHLLVGGGLTDRDDPTVSRLGETHVWNLPSKQLVRRVTGRFGRVFSVGYSPDGKTLIGASDDATIRFWNAESGAELAALQGHGGPINALAIDPGGRCVATASDDGTARVWDAHPWPEPTYAPSKQHDVTAFAILPDGRTVVTGGAILGDGDKNLPWLQAWDAESGRPLMHFQVVSDLPLAVAASSDGKHLAVLSRDGAVQLFDATTGQVVAELPERDRDLRNLRFLPNGRLALFSDRKLVVWAAADRTVTAVRTQTTSDRLIKAVGVAPNGRLLVAVSTGGLVRVEDAESGTLIVELVGHVEQVNAIAFGPDGTTVATGSHDRTARLWDLATGKALHTLRGHTYEVGSVTFDPSGRRLATAGSGYDRTARLWDTTTGQEVLTLPGGESLTFSANGQWLGAVGGGLRLWDGRPVTPDRATRREALQVVRFLARTVPDAAAARNWLAVDPPLRPAVRDAAAEMVEAWFRDMR